jgi:hypothetical protein
MGIELDAGWRVSDVLSVTDTPEGIGTFFPAALSAVVTKSPGNVADCGLEAPKLVKYPTWSS